jgi:hypothetical protein
MVGALADFLASNRVVGSHLLLTQADRVQRLPLGQIEDRAELDLVLEKMPWQEVFDRAPVSGGKPPQLGRGDLDRAGEIEGGETARWIPAPADGAGTGPGLRVLPLDCLVSEGMTGEATRGHAVDHRRYVAGGHPRRLRA